MYFDAEALSARYATVVTSCLSNPIVWTRTRYKPCRPAASVQQLHLCHTLRMLPHATVPAGPTPHEIQGCQHYKPALLLCLWSATNAVLCLPWIACDMFCKVTWRWLLSDMGCNGEWMLWELLQLSAQAQKIIDATPAATPAVSADKPKEEESSIARMRRLFNENALLQKSKKGHMVRCFFCICLFLCFGVPRPFLHVLTLCPHEAFSHHEVWCLDSTQPNLLIKLAPNCLLNSPNW